MTKQIAPRWQTLLQALTILAAGGWIFWPVLHGDWLWEDDLYLTGNPLMHDPAPFWKIWFEPGSFIEYYPLGESVQWAQWQLWHADTFGYHVTNVVLHLLNALLVWKLFSKLGLRLAWLGGLIFAIHPVMVESVAWIAELKNTLSLAPFLLAICFYLDHEEHGRRRDYLLALGFFLAAMLCKITMAPFPLVILLYGWWKRGRIGWRDLRATAPFFIISFILGMIALETGDWFRQAHLQRPDVVPIGDFFTRVALGGLTLSFYLWNSLWPVGLLPIYPKWTVDPPSLMQFLPWPLWGALFYLLWCKRTTWGRHVLLGLGFFLINLVPFLGFHAISYMSVTWVMDHFLYIPILGLIGLAVSGLGEIEKRITPVLRVYGIGAITVVMVLLAWESHGYAKKFVNEETLWSYTVSRNPDSWLAHYNLGEALTRKGEMPGAIDQYEQALRLNPASFPAHNNLGLLLFQAGRTSEAILHFQQAVAINPSYALGYDNLGNAFAQTGRTEEAIKYDEEALRLKPEWVQAHNDLGSALAQLGRKSEAKEQFKEALRLDPKDSTANRNLILLAAPETKASTNQTP